MKTIHLPAETFHIPFEELAHLIADALWPETGPDDPRWDYGCSRVGLDSELERAVKNGTLPVKSPVTFGPHTYPVGNALRSALVAVDDLRAFVAERGLSVKVEAPEQAAPAPSAAKPAPVVNGSAWDVSRPQRVHGYTEPLYRLLAAAHREGKPCPTSRDVLEAWRINRPAEIEKVLSDGIDYYDSNGSSKPASLDAIRKAIKRMTGDR